MDETGKIVFALEFESRWTFSEGLAPVRVKGKWGYIGRPGLIVIVPKYDKAEGFSQRRAKVEERNGEDENGRKYKLKTYYIDKTGTTWMAHKSSYLRMSNNALQRRPRSAVLMRPWLPLAAPLNADVMRTRDG